MIEPTSLRALALVAETGSVTGAADILGFTPSAVSQKLKRLEARIGVALLVRVGRGVALTPAGETLVARSVDVFAALESAAHAARARTRHASGTLHVVAFSTAIRGLLTRALPRLAVDHPDLTVRIDEADPAEALAVLASGGADLAIVHDSRTLPVRGADGPLRRACLRELCTDIGDVIVPAGHRLAGHAQVSAADLREETWVTSPPGTACHDWFRRLFARGSQPHVGHRIDDFSTQIALVLAGAGIALVPRIARPPLPDGLIALPVHPAPTRTVEALWRLSSDENPAVHALVQALTEATEAPTDKS
ncbi:DNA-binding transcriptional regulator, LysR family [Austwickia chelonae]|uniref:Putative LysR family transcriptional regulator n=1 Tax=Austwickia chelonae NBRC 105200 TaxID=1184607 RepID=K6VAG8_9MICO|nr:LysR family transcriptional regulator [Austwickia chelonae]GAB79233.1 putative LysR family transcriptional regulator [Austwickia chelonae NBRC 105200]SEW37462.1 DNA-binding transcriptional regulator, LysR family [Austwickia chelonae]